MVRDVLFPTSFALMYVNLSDAATALEVIVTVIHASDCPSYIVHRFLAIREIYEVLGVACSVPKQLTAQRAVEVGCYAQGLRPYEDVYRTSSDADVLRALSLLNQKLGAASRSCWIA